ncbi:hypothetical protein MNJPNG_26415 [Cupriavidus oxalaticus]
MAMIAVVTVFVTVFVAMRMAVSAMIVPRAGVIPGQCVFR